MDDAAYDKFMDWVEWVSVTMLDTEWTKQGGTPLNIKEAKQLENVIEQFFQNKRYS